MKTNVGRFELDSAGNRVPLHGEAGFAGMRRAGRLAAETLDFITPQVVPGVSTAELDRRLDAFMRDNGGVPATVGYKGYQHASCISVNHVVNHGIPNERKVLRNGDIVNIDVTPLVDGWHGDSSRMFLVGDKASVKARRLVDATYAAMMAGIAAARPGTNIQEIGRAIEAVAEQARVSVVYDFIGHGVGRIFHDAPHVFHYFQPDYGLILQPGMVFTVEPMLNAGRPETKILSDGWTAVTRDRSLSAQFEHSIGITEDGAEIFTLSPTGYHQPPYV